MMRWTTPAPRRPLRHVHLILPRACSCSGGVQPVRRARRTGKWWALCVHSLVEHCFSLLHSKNLCFPVISPEHHLSVWCFLCSPSGPLRRTSCAPAPGATPSSTCTRWAPPASSSAAWKHHMFPAPASSDMAPEGARSSFHTLEEAALCGNTATAQELVDWRK